MHSIEPARFTAPAVLEALAAGKAVELHHPGWTDTTCGACPHCGALVWHQLTRPDIRWVYGQTHAVLHRCNQPVDQLGDDPKWLRHMAALKELDEINRSLDPSRDGPMTKGEVRKWR